MNNVIIEDAIQKKLFSGCTVGFFNGNTQQVCCFGERNLGGGALKMRHDALFDIASLTKIFTFAGILSLVDRGTLSLDDRVTKFLPFEQGGDIQKMTLRHLLSCGLDFVFSEEVEKHGIHLADAKGNLLVYKCAKLRAPLGTMFRYGNPSAFFAGEVLRTVTKKSFDKALYELVLEPIGMEDTSFSVSPDRLIRIVPSQTIKTNQWQFQGDVQDPMSLAFKRPVGIAGLFSSIYNMVLGVRMLAANTTLYGVPFLSERLWREMVSDQHVGKTYDGIVHRYALGIDMPSPDYVRDPFFCKNGLIMSGASGPYLFACPSWHRNNLPPRPVGGVILLHGNRRVPDIKTKLKAFRRAFLQSCLDSITE